jgi:hypothetical protein
VKYSSAYISRSNIRLHFVLPEPLSILKSSGNLRRGLLLDGGFSIRDYMRKIR